ncbi:hypothetical protein VTN49DRAFT_7892 [Thermomyces lanuginosus]|uniref:uncharacterized protein n=1 Tax=Thermomyces lanuginosus TaxID=5541 RepID=UPI003742F346
MVRPAVNRPMDPKVRDQDIDNQLRLYGIYNAFAAGKLPSNKQCDVAMNSVIDSKWLSSPSTDLSEEGRRLVQDLREVLQQAKLLFLSKNEGELLQEFIWNAQHISGGDLQKISAPADKERTKQDADRATEGFRTLGTLIITNGEFRKLLSDAVTLLREIASDAASMAASRVGPSEEQRSQIDKPAEDNVWHEKPDFEMMKNQAKSAEQKGEETKPKVQKDVQEAAGSGTDAATGGRDGVPVRESEPTAGASAAAGRLKETGSQQVPDEAKAKAEEVKGKANEYARQVREFLASKMPKERRDQVIFRLKKMIIEIQGHPDYRRAVETLLSLAENYGGHAQNVAQQGAGAARGAQANTNLQKAKDNLKTLIERFANSTSTDDLFDSINSVYRDADQDPQLRDWFKAVDSYIRKCLEEQGFIMEDAANEEWNRLYDQGRYLLRERYRSHTDRIVNEIKFLASQFNEDPQNQAFRQSVEKLLKDLGQDPSGRAQFKPHLVKDIFSVIIPQLFEGIRHVPIPRIEVADPAFDVVVENLVVESDNLMPNVCELNTDNYWRWGRKNISSKDDHRIMISASGIQADIKDVNYYIKKKQGFPSLTDQGVMDLYLGGSGFSFKIAASKAQAKDRAQVFKPDKVSVDVKNLDIKLKKSQHRVLFNLFKPLLFSIVRPAIERVLEYQVRDAFRRADAFAFQVQNEVKRAKEAALNDPSNAPNIFNSYVDAVRQVMMQKKEQAQAASQRDTKVSAAMTYQDIIFPQIKMPGGVTNKATEYKELAGKGERWQSPVFDWGTASPSKEIPKVADPTRKPHGATNGGLRERAGGVRTGDLKPGPDGTTAKGEVNGSFKKQVDQAFETNGGPAIESPLGTTGVRGTAAFA